MSEPLVEGGEARVTGRDESCRSVRFISEKEKSASGGSDETRLKATAGMLYYEAGNMCVYIHLYT